MELDRTTLGEGVLGCLAAIVSYFSKGFKYQNILLIKVHACVNLDIKNIIYS